MLVIHQNLCNLIQLYDINQQIILLHILTYISSAWSYSLSIATNFRAVLKSLNSRTLVISNCLHILCMILQQHYDCFLRFRQYSHETYQLLLPINPLIFLHLESCVNQFFYQILWIHYIILYHQFLKQDRNQEIDEINYPYLINLACTTYLTLSES